MRPLSLATIFFGIVLVPATSPLLAADGFPAGYLYLATEGGVIELDSTGATIRTLNVGGEANGLAFAPNGNLVVSVADQDEIVEVAPDGSIVMTITGVTGQPFGVCVGPDGRIYSTSWGTSGVRVFGRDGSSLATIGAGSISGGAGLTFGPGGNLFVCSSSNDELVEIAPDGTHLGDIAAGGPVLGPRDVLLTSRGTLVVGTWTSGSLYQTDIDGSVIDTDATTTAPQALAMGPDGYLYVADVQVVKRYELSDSGFDYDGEFASPTVGIGSIYDMAFAPQRIKVKVVGKVVGSGGDQKISENAVLSVCADGYQIMLMPDPFGALATYMEPFVGYGPELHSEQNGAAKRSFIATQVNGDAGEYGVSTISVAGKGYLDFDDRFRTKKASGTLIWWSRGVSLTATLNGKKTVN